ncbi:MAG: DNA polymerase II large subunit, partial [Thermoplasmata archaeon]|nr:DNA polymerase II large subunit [Thermoplasmata archaeon]
PTDKEVERYKEEIRLYRRIQHLQYLPSNEEIDLIARGCPVCIDGDGTEDEEVSGNRDLERVETNRVRSGACLVMAEGMCLKAPKVQRHVQRLGVDGWEFIGDLLALMHKPTDDGDGLTDEELEAASEHDEKPEEVDDLEDLADGELDLELVRELEHGQAVEVSANVKYMKELIAGRPVLAHPSRQGGFRLRYGRTRATGLAAIAMSPATMVALDRFVAIGTQLKIEQPGKAGAITPCDTIEGPIALLKNGDLVEIDTVEKAKEYASAVRTFYDVGEVLIPFGEFLENNHALVPGSYSPEWWEEDVRAADPEGAEGRLDGQDMTFERALAISRELEVPLHPRYNLFWHDMEPGEIALLSELFDANGRMDDDHLVLPKDVVDEGTKDIICRLGALHRARADVLVFGHHSCALLLCLGLEPDGKGGVARRRQVPADRFDNPLALVSYTAGVHVRARAPTRIGARMGRPEKAKERKMKPPPHVIFPVGAAGGSQRLVNDAIRAGRIQVEMGHRRCPSCGKRTPFSMCECGTHTLALEEPSRQYVDMSKVMSAARSRLGDSSMPNVKGVKGMVSKQKVPEPLEKGILRAKHNVFVFKDGTVRYDMTDVPVTHFRPREIGLSVERAKELGYLVSADGSPLKDGDQVVELRPQDIIPSYDCGDYMVRTSRFMDDMLVKLYGLPAYYGAERKEDLIGHLTIGLAPHTSGGVLCRIIGFTRALGCYAHPFFHASKRR